MSRLKPSFMIIGGVKCASSSLYRYLNSHPQVLPCKTKEPSLFNKSLFQIIKGLPSYKKLYPNIKGDKVVADWVELSPEDQLENQTFSKKIVKGTKYITGEASVIYATRANPKYVKLIYPRMKLIYIMRDPAERFLSHYDMFERFVKEGRRKPLPVLEEFIDQEIASYKSGATTSILSQGLYYENLEKWQSVFEGNMYLLRDLDINEQRGNDELNRLSGWLGLGTHDFTEVITRRFNQASTRTKNIEALEKLNLFYKPHNDNLEEKYSIQFDNELNLAR